MSKTVTIKIEGMRCKGCAMGTQGALEKLAQVESARVSFPEKTAVVTCREGQYDEAALRAAVEGAGFRATEIQ